MSKSKFALIMIAALVILVTIMGSALAGPLPEPCTTYEFIWSDDPEDSQIYAQGSPHELTVSGPEVPAGDYVLQFITGDNHRNQEQDKEQALLLFDDQQVGPTPDIPTDSEIDPGVWVFITSTYTVTAQASFSQLTARHAFAGEDIGAQSLSPISATFTRCDEPAPTPTDTSTSVSTATPTRVKIPRPTITPTDRPTPAITPVPRTWEIYLPVGYRSMPTPTPTATPAPTITPTPSRTPIPQAAVRFDLEVAEQHTPAFGTYALIDVVSGSALTTWYAHPGWEDSGCIWFTPERASTEARVTFTYESTGETITLNILNSPFVESGTCHALEVSFP